MSVCQDVSMLSVWQCDGRCFPAMGRRSFLPLWRMVACHSGDGDQAFRWGVDVGGTARDSPQAYGWIWGCVAFGSVAGTEIIPKHMVGFGVALLLGTRVCLHPREEVVWSSFKVVRVRPRSFTPSICVDVRRRCF